MSRVEPKLRELMQTLGEPPHPVTAQAVRHQVVRRRRRTTVIAAAAAVAVLAAVIPAFAGAYSGPAPSGTGSAKGSYLTPLPGGRGVYHDVAGWMIDVLPGWHVRSFRSTKNGAVAAGAQISNVPLPVPVLMPGFPVQASGETLPAGGVSLVIVTDTDPRVCRPGPHPSPAGGSNYCQRAYLSPPVTFKEMNMGSSSGDSPVTSFLWVKAGGTTLSLTTKFGASAFSDHWITPVNTMLATLSSH